MPELRPSSPLSPPLLPPPGRRSGLPLVGLAALVLAVGLAVYWLVREDRRDAPSPVSDSDAVVTVDVGGRTAALSITTTPAGAVVIVDDRIVGESPVVAMPVTVGLHAVRCEKAGFQAAVRQIDTRRGAQQLSVELEPIGYAQLVVTSEPDQAQVLIDGEFRGRTPTVVEKLTPGPHEIVIAKENFSTYQATQVLHTGERKELHNVVLENKLLLMLRELVATEPRLISNHLDLAHYYYVNNRMEAAARAYKRVNELASLPMEILPEEATEAEKEQVRLNYEWDKNRVRSEVDKHTRKYKQYFGNNLDFELFLKRYREYSAAKWDIRNFDWVAAEGDLQIARGNPARAVELFSDARVLEPQSVAAAAGLARALMAGGNPGEGLPLVDSCLAKLGKDKLTQEDRKAPVRIWRWLATASVDAGAVATSTERPALLAQAEQAVKAAEAVQVTEGKKADPYETAWLLWLRAQLTVLEQDKTALSAGLLSALAVAREAVETDKNGDHRERNQAQREQFQMEAAWALYREGKTGVASELWKDLAKTGNPDQRMQLRAREILDALSAGKNPAP